MAGAAPEQVPRRGRPRATAPNELASDRAGPGASSPIEPAPLTPAQVRLLPFYHDLKNEIVEPDKVVVSSQYFWTRWAPRLGPTLTALVVCLRRHCYYNRTTQERRDWCFPEQATLAREIGVESTKTIRAALRHQLAERFVRREARYVYDPKRGKKVRTSDMYYVAMDDPLLPEDEARLALRAAARLLAEGRGAELAADPDRPHQPVPPMGKKDRQVTRRAPVGQIDRQVAGPTGRSFPQDSAALSALEVVPEESTDTTKYSNYASAAWSQVLAAFAAANAASPTPAQRDRLAALAAQFDPIARGVVPPTSGARWVLAAIEEAVESGSRFVAPRRIARICARWAAEGFPGSALTRPEGVGEPSSPLLAGEGEGEGEGRPFAGGDIVAPAALTLTLSPRERGKDASRDRGLAPLPPGEGGGEGGSHDQAPAPLTPPPSGSFVVFPDLDLYSRPFWRAVCEDAGPRLGSPGDRRLLEGSRLLGRDGGALVVGVPSRSAARRAELRLAAVLAHVARSILGRDVELRFVNAGELPDG